MGILQLFPQKEFYTSVDRTSFSRGQFCWIPVPHLEPIPRILDVQRSTGKEHFAVQYELRYANRRQDFVQNDRHLPIKNLNLRANEELLIHRAKKRPAIIICAGVDLLPEVAVALHLKGKEHLQEDCLFLVPGYSIESEENLSGFPSEMVARIRCLIFRQFFYFPETKGLREGVARFDRIQVVIGRDPAAIEPTEISFSKEVKDLFIGMFQYCVTGIEDDDIRAARELCREAYPD